MQNDVFISYSRKDYLEVNKLIDLLHSEIPGIKIWYDIDGIETAAAFRSKIMRAIDQSNVILFVSSVNSLVSEYCESELMYAKHKNKKILPFLISGYELEDWQFFELHKFNCIHACLEDEVNRMIKDLKKWVDINSSSSSKANDVDIVNINIAKPELGSKTDEFKQNCNAESRTKIELQGNYINGHEYVDLGLPSGLKWAACNVGASKPEEYGDYFAWGEIKVKSAYLEDNSETYNKNDYRLQGYLVYPRELNHFHDAACQNWGKPWRMPTFNEIEELIHNTKTEWTTLNGVNGRMIKSKKNRNSIFLPTAGIIEGTSILKQGEYGYYWSSSPREGDSMDSYYLNVFSGHFFWNWCGRYYGLSVRPVTK